MKIKTLKPVMVEGRHIEKDTAMDLPTHLAKVLVNASKAVPLRADDTVMSLSEWNKLFASSLPVGPLTVHLPPPTQ